jgi:probable HAF family extracellular repeat protein
MNRITAGFRSVFYSLILLVACSSCSPPPGQVKYEISDLGTLSQNSYATAINNNGQVVGYAFTSNGVRAFIHENGAMKEIAAPGGLSGAAFAINDSGLVVGYYNDSNGARRAFSWANNSAKSLGSFGMESVAHGVNNTGKIVGDVVYHPENSTNVWRSGFVYENGKMSYLRTWWGFNEVAMDINNNNLIVGADEINAGFITGQDRFIQIFNGGTFTQIDDEEGVRITGSANSVNDAGDIAGWMRGKPNYKVQAFTATPEKFTKLGTLGGDFSYASCINYSGHVVGASTAKDGSLRAFIYSSKGMKDLNTLVKGTMAFTSLLAASGINDQGSIVGWGQLPNGDVHAFLAKPVLVKKPF